LLIFYRDDVLNSLKKTGFYEPPGVFFRYFGFIYTRIRRKPIIAENLQECIKSGEKTISLFDLFFHYTTPILIANDEYYEIPLHHTAYIKDTTTREGKSWIGNAHVNFRPIEKKIVNPNEKNVFVWKGSKQLNSAHDRYMRTWGTFYDMYEKI